MWAIQAGLSANRHEVRDIRDFREFRESAFRIFGEVILPESELAFVDLQRLDAALKSRRWNLKLSGRP
jgi:hypothetical protein